MELYHENIFMISVQGQCVHFSLLKLPFLIKRLLELLTARFLVSVLHGDGRHSSETGISPQTENGVTGDSEALVEKCRLFYPIGTHQSFQITTD